MKGDIQMAKIEIGSNKINNSSCHDSLDSKTCGCIFKDFAWATRNITNFIPISTDPANPTLVANVMLFGLQPGDEIWLNGLFKLNNDSDSSRAVVPVILKNDVIIYELVLEVDSEGDDDQAPIPVQTVDVINESGPVNYTLAVRADDVNVNLNGPVTFTAMVIRR